jgi:hypothetical protein
MPTTRSADWDTAFTRAASLRARGAGFHRTIRSDVWWVDPVPNPATRSPATYWVTGFADECFSCVCDQFLGRKHDPRPCAHIARVCLETGATPMIWTENPTCKGGHDKVVKGYTKEALHHPNCGCTA